MTDAVDRIEKARKARDSPAVTRASRVLDGICPYAESARRALLHWERKKNAVEKLRRNINYDLQQTSESATKNVADVNFKEGWVQIHRASAESLQQLCEKVSRQAIPFNIFCD